MMSADRNEIPQTRLRWIRKGLRIACLFVALLPALWVLTHPIPVVWLRPICKDTWAIVLACAIVGTPLLLFRRIEGRAWSLSVDSANTGHLPSMVLQHWLASCAQSLSNLGHLSVQRCAFVLQRRLRTAERSADHCYAWSPASLSCSTGGPFKDFHARLSGGYLRLYDCDGPCHLGSFRGHSPSLGWPNSHCVFSLRHIIYTCPLFRIVHDGATCRGLLPVRSCHAR